MEGPYNVSDEDLDKFMQVAVKLVHEVGEMISNAMATQQNVEIELKGGDNLGEGHGSSVLTEVDMKVEQHLMTGLKAAFPDHEFIGEENFNQETGVQQFNNVPTWIIDPIDGTLNFIHNNPLVCTSIGLAVNRRLVIGIINCPVIGFLYTARKGHGAFLNGKKLSVSGVKKLEKAMVIMELPTGAKEEKREAGMKNLTQFLTRAHAIRCPGPAAMDIAFVGAGSADCYFHYGAHCWDYAAGAVIVTEAGGVVLDPSGKEFDYMSRNVLVAANTELAQQAVSLLTPYPTIRDFPEVCPM